MRKSCILTALALAILLCAAAFAADVLDGFIEFEKRREPCGMINVKRQAYLAQDSLARIFPFTVSTGAAGILTIRGKAVSSYVEKGRTYLNGKDFAEALNLDYTFKRKSLTALFSARSPSSAPTPVEKPTVAIAVRARTSARVSDPVNDTSHTYTLVVTNLTDKALTLKVAEFSLTTDTGSRYEATKNASGTGRFRTVYEPTFTVSASAQREVVVSFSMPERERPQTIACVRGKKELGKVRL